VLQGNENIHHQGHCQQNQTQRNTQGEIAPVGMLHDGGGHDIGLPCNGTAHHRHGTHLCNGPGKGQQIGRKNLIGTFIHQQTEGFHPAQPKALCRLPDRRGHPVHIGFHIAHHNGGDQHNLGHNHNLHRKQQLQMPEGSHTGKQHIKQQAANHRRHTLQGPVCNQQHIASGEPAGT